MVPCVNGIDPAGWFVEEEHLGIVQYRAHEVQAHLHALRILAYPLVAGVDETDDLEQFGRRTGLSRVQRSEELDVLPS